MAEHHGDVVYPSELYIPRKDGTYVGKKEGEIWLSGTALYIMVSATTFEIVTST